MNKYIKRKFIIYFRNTIIAHEEIDNFFYEIIVARSDDLFPEFIKDLGSFGRYRIGLDGSDDKTEYKNIIIYLFFSNQKSLQPIDKNNPEARWVNTEDAYNMLTHKADKVFFKKTLSSWLHI